MTNSGTTYNILSLVENDFGNLIDPHYFGQYEAIVLEPTWNVLGLQDPETTGAIVAGEEMLQRRSRELRTFFEKGGLLVVWLVPAEPRLSYTGQNYLDNHIWWVAHLGVIYQPGSHDPLIAPGGGVSVEPVEPGHAFEAYLGSGPKYKARLGRDIASHDHVTVLATNRAGEPVAAEVAVAAGSVVIVPPPGGVHQAELLSKAVEATLKTRFGLGFEWKVPEELDLDKERSVVLRQLRDKRRRLDDRRVAMERVKAEVFKTIEVRRAFNYWREAIGPGATPKKAMVALYNMLEMFAGYFDCGWAEVAQTLNVSHKSMKRIGDLANRKTLNLRHATSGNPQDVDPEEFDRILKEARHILQAFINRQFKEAANTVRAVS